MTTEITIPESALPPGVSLSEYQASLDAKINPGQTTTADTATAEAKVRPDNIPEKFWDGDKGEVRIEALLKSQSELEKRFSQGEHKAKATPLSIEADAPADAATTTPANGEHADIVSAYDAFQTVLTEKAGELDDADFAALEKHVPRSIIETQLAMAKEHAAMSAELESLRREKFEGAIFESAGGVDKYNSITAWAAAALSQDEQAQFNALISKSDTAQFAFEGLKARYQAANPSEGQRITAPTSTAGGDVFRDQSELTAAINSTEYRRSEAFRTEVESKINRSLKAGTLR